MEAIVSQQAQLVCQTNPPRDCSRPRFGGHMSASIPNTKEPQGLSSSDGKRPDGLTLVPWQSGKPLVWDVTVVCPLADSYIASAARDPSSTAETAALNKIAKYAGLTADYHFQLIAVESLGLANESAVHFLVARGKKIAQQTGDERETTPFCFSVYQS